MNWDLANAFVRFVSCYWTQQKRNIWFQLSFSSCLKKIWKVHFSVSDFFFLLFCHACTLKIYTYLNSNIFTTLIASQTLHQTPVLCILPTENSIWQDEIQKVFTKWSVLLWTWLQTHSSLQLRFTRPNIVSVLHEGYKPAVLIKSQKKHTKWDCHINLNNSPFICQVTCIFSFSPGSFKSMSTLWQWTESWHNNGALLCQWLW